CALHCHARACPGHPEKEGAAVPTYARWPNERRSSNGYARPRRNPGWEIEATTPASVRSSFRFGRGQTFRLSSHRDQHAAAEQALGHALGVVDGHRVDQLVAALDVIHAEIVELD